MNYELVVKEPFHDGTVRHARGAIISDPDAIKAAQASHPRHVMRRAIPAAPAPTKQSA